MACNGYLPTFQKQLNSADPLGSANCTAYSGGMAGDYHTCGAKKPAGKRVRELTGDYVGGTTLIQIDAALNKGWGIDLETRIGGYRLTWTEFANKIASGRGAILQGGYSAIQYTKYSGSRTFGGNHAIFVPPRWKVADPLCDGRREEIYKYHGEQYPASLLEEFAGRLILDPVTGRKLGRGYVWASLTRDNTSNTILSWKVVVPKGTFIRYKLANGIIVGYEKYKTGGFSAGSSRPKIYKAKGQTFSSRTLVMIKTGAYQGWFIGARYAQEI